MSKLGYTWYPKDFASDPDVMMMNSAERGIYRDLIDLAYQTNNNITYSFDALAKYTNGDIEDIKKVLNLKGEKTANGWKIPNCDKRISLAERNRENGKKGGRKPKRNPDGTQNVTQTEPRRKGKEKEKEKGKENIYMPPSLKEMKDYCIEKGYDTSIADEALTYYTDLNWHDKNGNKISSWKHKLLRVWFKPERKVEYNSYGKPKTKLIF